jgi:hypothetical protein
MQDDLTERGLERRKTKAQTLRPPPIQLHYAGRPGVVVLKESKISPIFPFPSHQDSIMSGCIPFTINVNVNLLKIRKSV